MPRLPISTDYTITKSLALKVFAAFKISVLGDGVITDY